MKVAITGTRAIEQAINMRGELYEALASLPPGSSLVLGDATGIDSLARGYAEMNKIPFVREKADWPTFGRGAGPIRNKAMLDHEPDEVWWFHPNLSESKGTRNCVEQARQRGIPIRGWGDERSPNR